MNIDDVFENIKSALDFLIGSKIVGVEVGVGSVVESKEIFALAIEKDGIRYLIRITGDLDFSIVQIKDSWKKKKLLEQIIKIIETLESDEYELGVPEDKIIEMAHSKAISKSMVKEVLSELKKLGQVYCPRRGFYKLVSLRD